MEETKIPDAEPMPAETGSPAPQLPPKAIAIISFAEDLARRGEVSDQKSIAQRLGIGEATLIRYMRAHQQVEKALGPVLPLPASKKIERALDQLLKEGAVITQVLIAERAGVGTNTVSRIKAEDAELGKRIDTATATSLGIKIETLVRKRDSEGLPVTQKWIADELGVSESTVVNYKNTDPAIYRIIEDALPLSAVEAVRGAIEDLKAENIPPTVAHIVERTGLHQATVSKIKTANPALDAVIPSAAEARPPMDRGEAEEALAARIQIYGDERCNTVSALDRAKGAGGDRALLRACREWRIPLPRAQPREVDALVAYLNRIADTKPLFEEEAAGLWNKAKAGDREAVEELLVRTRPLVKFVINNSLHEEINPADFKSSLIEHLISEGDLIITESWDKWDGKGGLLWYFGRTLRDGLRKARLAYYSSRKTEERVLLPAAPPPASFDREDGAPALAGRKQPQSPEMPPDVSVGILSDEFPFNEDELVVRRDVSSGISIILPLNKQVMAAALGEVFRSPEISAAFESGVRNDWAVFMAGSTGRLGTAVLGESAAYLVILTDATDIFTRKTMLVIAGWLSGRIEEHEGALPTINIGKKEDFDGIMRWTKVDDDQNRILRKFVVTLNKFGVGLSPGKGIAAIDAATVGSAEGTASHISDVELYFQTAKNGIRIAASKEGAHEALIKKLMTRASRSDASESAAAALKTADEVLNFELSFLEGQKALLEKARAGKRPPAAKPKT